MLFQEQKCVVEIWNFKDRYFKALDKDDDKLPGFRVELKTFTRFVFKLVFRVSGRGVLRDIPVTSKRTGVHNFQLLSVKAYWSLNKWYINISYFRFILPNRAYFMC